MKYTIEGFSQPGALALKERGLDTDDLVLLRWFADFAKTGKMESRTDDTGNLQYWLKASKVVDELPFIFSEKRAVYRRIKKLTEMGVLTHSVINEKNGVNGKFTFVGFGTEFHLLTDIPSTTDGTTPSTTDGTTPSTTDGTTPSTTDGTTPSTTDGTSKILPPYIPYTRRSTSSAINHQEKQHLQELWEYYIGDDEFMTEKELRFIEKELKNGFTIDDFEEALKRTSMRNPDNPMGYVRTIFERWRTHGKDIDYANE